VAVRSPDTHGATGWTLEIHDLLIPKYVAGRPKDREFIRESIRGGMAAQDALLARLGTTELREDVAQSLATRIRSDFGEIERAPNA